MRDNRLPSSHSISRLFCLLLLGLVVPTLLSATTIRYHVSVPDPASEHFVVAADIEDLKVDTLRFSFPLWAPGAYDLVHFGLWVRDIRAEDAAGNGLPMIPSDTGSWIVVDPPERMRIFYDVDDIESHEGSPWFSISDIDTSWNVAFANTSALFGYPEDVEEVDYHVTYVPPADWKVAIGLEPVEGGEAYTYHPGSYDLLVDSPVMMGPFEIHEFEVGDVPHELVLVSVLPVSDEIIDDLIDETEDVVELIGDFFGEIPYDRYLFQIVLVDPRNYEGGYGALEHLQSSTYLMPWSGPNIVPMLLPVIAHEHWHVWSPKLFHVDHLGPFEYREAPRTSSLWFHEGITDYYAHKLLAREGMIERKDYLADFARRLDWLSRNAGTQSLTETSRRITELSFGELARVYVDGPAAAMLLDYEIERQTGGERSLDDAMRHFNEVYGDHRGGEDFGDDDIIGIIEEATGADLGEFYRRYIDGVERPPIEAILEGVGLRAVIKPEFGCYLLSVEDGWKILVVDPGYTADATGVLPDDVLVSITVDGVAPEPYGALPFSSGQLDTILAGPPDREILLGVRRNGEVIELPLVIRNKIAGIVEVDD